MPEARLTDRELLNRMSAGDHTALAQAYDRWARVVTALIVHVVRDAEAADDVVEDTFWQLWRQASRYDPARGTVGTWLLTMARNRAIDRMRARRRLREEPPTPLLVPQDTVPPPSTATTGEFRSTIFGALQTLPTEQRQVLDLAYFGGANQSEISERTGQPVGTVKTHVRLAVQKLRACLAILPDDVERRERRLT